MLIVIMVVTMMRMSRVLCMFVKVASDVLPTGSLQSARQRLTRSFAQLRHTRSQKDDGRLLDSTCWKLRHGETVPVFAACKLGISKPLFGTRNDR